MAAPTSLTYQYTDTDGIKAILSENGMNLRLDDSADGTVQAGELAVLTDSIINEATDEVNGYLLRRYRAVNLMNSWKVRRVTSVIACVMLCRRRGNSVPEDLMDEYDRVLDWLEAVHDNDKNVAGIQEIEATQPIMSNVSLDDRFRTRRLRVQRSISSRDPATIPQAVDYRSEYYPER